MKKSTIYRVEFKNSENNWEVFREVDTWERARYEANTIEQPDMKITRIDTKIEETVLMERILEPQGER